MTAPSTDLATIRTKIRRITRNPTAAQITDTEINDYINTFVLYDFPEHIRLFTLRENFSFYTTANIDVYDSTNTLYDPNVYISVHQPLYIAGNPGFYTQSREQFYRIYPHTNFEQQIGTGDGATTTFTTTLSDVPLLRNSVTVSSEDAGGSRLLAIDDGNGNLQDKNTVGTIGVNIGTINYTTGAITITWLAAPAANQAVNAQYIPYVASRPQAALFFNNQFTLRPVPDNSYKIEIEVYRRPTALLADNASPELNQWWQYIAYGAAKKIFEDRMDIESVQMIMPEFKEQQRLALRKTIVQQTNERVATIYTENTQFAYGNFYNNGGF